MNNRATLAQLLNMNQNQVNNLPMDQIAMLQDDLANIKKEVKAYECILHDCMKYNFSFAAEIMRKQDNRDTGSVTIPMNGYKVRADLPKMVEWNQSLLRKAIDIIDDRGENPEEYVTIDIKVSEVRYNAWPSSIKVLFEPARTVSCGKASYKMEVAL
jgi:hypothetical protein